jgi:hypothetical protein
VVIGGFTTLGTTLQSLISSVNTSL